MASTGRPAPQPSRGIDTTAIERSNQVIRQLADVGIKVRGYSLGRKLDLDVSPPDSPKQGPLGTVAQYSQLSDE